METVNDNELDRQIERELWLRGNAYVSVDRDSAGKIVRTKVLSQDELQSEGIVDTERRCFDADEEVRFIEPTDDRPARIEGLVVPYDKPSVDLGGYREVWAPGSAAASIANAEDKRADVDHDPTKLLARTGAGSLRFRDTPEGLYASIDLPDTSVGRDAREDVRSKLRHSLSVSFKRRTVCDRFERRDGQPVRVIERADVTGVALTAFPLFPQTAGEVNLRSLAAWEKEQGADELGVAGDVAADENRVKRLELLELSE